MYTVLLFSIIYKSAANLSSFSWTECITEYYYACRYSGPYNYYGGYSEYAVDDDEAQKRTKKKRRITKNKF